MNLTFGSKIFHCLTGNIRIEFLLGLIDLPSRSSQCRGASVLPSVLPSALPSCTKIRLDLLVRVQQPFGVENNKSCINCRVILVFFLSV